MIEEARQAAITGETDQIASIIGKYADQLRTIGVNEISIGTATRRTAESIGNMAEVQFSRLQRETRAGESVDDKMLRALQDIAVIADKIREENTKLGRQGREQMRQEEDFRIKDKAQKLEEVLLRMPDFRMPRSPYSPRH
jgi:hypothetical protein